MIPLDPNVNSATWRDVAKAAVAIAVLTPIATGLAIANFMISERRAWQERQERLARHRAPPGLARGARARVIRILDL